jgi:hypothetical protein
MLGLFKRWVHYSIDCCVFMPGLPLDCQVIILQCCAVHRTICVDDDFIARRTLSLLACALVAHSWVETAQSLLFRAPQVAKVDIWDPLRGSARALAKLNHTLETSCPESNLSNFLNIKMLPIFLVTPNVGIGNS